MEKMSQFKKTIFLAALLSTGSACVLKSNHSNVVPKLTEDVTLRCSCENAQSKMDQLVRIRLLKQSEESNWRTVAEISVPNNSTVSLPHPFSSKIVASGHLGTSVDSFLSVTWPTADDDMVGSYQCEVDGFGEDFRSDIHLSTQSVNITNFLPTTTDLVSIIIKMKHEIQSAVEDNFLEVRYWPEGNYTLLSPVSGCPDTPYTKMVRDSTKIITKTTSIPNNTLSSPSHLHSDVFERCDNRNVLHFRFCRNPFPYDQALPWPKGSYCIHCRMWNICPSGFKAGYIDAYLKSSSNVEGSGENTGSSIALGSTFAEFYFCCRNDGDPQMPVLLPNNKPFYLFRYKGRCQEVRNMDVSDEWIQLDTGSKDSIHALTPDAELNDFILRMCFYTKRE